MQVLPLWRVVRVLVGRALVKWDSPVMAPLAVSPGSLSNPWLEPRLHLAGRCPVALALQAEAWAWPVTPWVVAWVPLGAERPVDPWAVAWA